MELILISSSKLKIMLDETDMKQYNIGDETDCAQIATRKAIRSILDRARERIGFNTEGSEIFVQLYTSKKGGCELFVTKSGVEDAAKADGALHKSKDTSGEKKPRRRDGGKSTCEALTVREGGLVHPYEPETGKMIFSFSSVNDLCAVCKLLDAQIYSSSLKSRALTDGNSFYLILDNVGMSAYSRLDKLTFILEYGERERTDSTSTYLGEHGRIICDGDAIKILGAL